MKLLFDTHAFIWWDGEQAKLSAAALAACQSPANSLHLSLASVWELQIKMQLGKLALRLSLADVLRDQQQQNGLVPTGDIRTAVNYIDNQRVNCGQHPTQPNLTSAF